MDQTEFDGWVRQMKADRGRWSIDPIHDGQNGRDFLAYRPSHSDHTRGLYFNVSSTGELRTGNFEGAVPHIGEASFRVFWSKKFADQNEAITKMIERIGARFVLDAICR